MIWSWRRTAGASRSPRGGALYHSCPPPRPPSQYDAPAGRSPVAHGLVCESQCEGPSGRGRMRKFVVLVVVVAVAVIAGATPIGARTAKEAAYVSAVHDRGVSGLTASMIVEFGHQFCRDTKRTGFRDHDSRCAELRQQCCQKQQQHESRAARLLQSGSNHELLRRRLLLPSVQGCAEGLLKELSANDWPSRRCRDALPLACVRLGRRGSTAAD